MEKLNNSALRKMLPVGTIVTEYFPDALRAVAAVAWVGNQKHNPGQPLHWSRENSTDHVDCIVRHLQDAAAGNNWDLVELADGKRYAVLHTAAAAWRALAVAQLVAEKFHGYVIHDLSGAKVGEDSRDYITNKCK